MTETYNDKCNSSFLTQNYCVNELAERYNSKVYLEPCQTSKREPLQKYLMSDFSLLTTFAKRSILYVWQGSEYTFITPVMIRIRLSSGLTSSNTSNLIQNALRTKLIMNNIFSDTT